MSNAVQDFLKMAKQRTEVKTHVRVSSGKPVLVRRYVRDDDDENDEGGLHTEDQAGLTTPEGAGEPDDAAVTEVDDAVVDVVGPPGAAGTDALKERQQRDLELWVKWNINGRKKEDLAPLLAAFKPMIGMKAAVFSGKVRIPPAAVELQHKRVFAEGLAKYDPSKGSLGTYMYRYLDKAKRWIIENQNIGRIPENRAYKIGEFKSVKADLAETLGREPTTKELASELGWKREEVERMEAEDRADLTSQAFEEDPFAYAPSKEEEVLRLFKYELEGTQRAVYEHLTGMGREQITSTGELSKKLKIPDYQVSRIKQQIQLKLRRYLEG